MEPAFFDQLCGAVARSMGVEPDEKASRAFFSALDTDEVGTCNVWAMSALPLSEATL